MIQLPLAPHSVAIVFPESATMSPLARRILEWTVEHGPASPWQLTDAMGGISVGEVDLAAQEADVMHWENGRYIVRLRGAEGVMT